MKKIFLFASILLLISLRAVPQNAWMNVADYGADLKGIKKCTEIINSLINKLSERGGGTVYFPAGTYLTGPVMMKSNIVLYLDAGAVIKFSDDFDDYIPMVPSHWEGVRVKNFRSQIYAYQCENIAITGRGHFEGQGRKWWDFLRVVNSKQQPESKWQELFRKENADLLAKNEYIRTRNNFLRPPMVMMYECKNILIQGVSFSNPPFWTIVPVYSENITIDGITIENPEDSPNTDGIDPSSCRNVHISNCHISVGDDCIVIKSGRDEDGREAGKPTENITITNCTMLKGHGGVVIGSEMSGGVRRVTVSNCVFEGTDRGIRIKTMRGRGGVIEDLLVSNIVMKDMVNEGVLITLRYQATKPEPVSERTPACKNVNISGIVVRGGQRPVAVYGLEERDVTDISFSNIESNTRRGILIENASGISFHDMKIEISDGNALEARDSKNIVWDMVSVISSKISSIIKLNGCRGIRVSNCQQTENIALYINEDENTSDIYITNNILPATVSLVNGKARNIIIRNNILSAKSSTE